jgi:hypothetical protein
MRRSREEVRRSTERRQDTADRSQVRVVSD